MCFNVSTSRGLTMSYTVLLTTFVLKKKVVVVTGAFGCGNYNYLDIFLRTAANF